MDYSIILPAAGRSTRFAGRPKWSKTVPDGQMMLTHSITGLISRKLELYIGLLNSHVEDLGFDIDKLKLFLNDKYNSNILSLCENQTASHAQTVFTMVSGISSSCGIFIKDVDNYFETNLEDYFQESYGYISAVPANEFNGKIDNKSTIELDENGFVKKISENAGAGKNLICVGGYAFPNKSIFIESYKNCAEQRKELKISDVINNAISLGIKFKTKVVHNYIDYGTQEEWEKYKNDFATLFVDFDGVLVENGSEYFKNKWENSNPIIENINAINKSSYYIVITSSRPESMRAIVVEQLNKYGIKYDQLVLGLPACKRIVINDRAEQNEQDTAFSINVNRNSISLNKELKKIFGG